MLMPGSLFIWGSELNYKINTRGLLCAGFHMSPSGFWVYCARLDGPLPAPHCLLLLYFIAFYTMV